MTVDIGIIEDCKFEQTEVFNASLSFIVVPPHVTLKPDRTEINITDADGELIQSPHRMLQSFISALSLCNLSCLVYIAIHFQALANIIMKHNNFES